MNPGLRNLIALQDLEQKISSLQKQISDTPAKVKIYEDELEHLKRAHQDRVTRVQEFGKQRRTLEGEVDLLRAKLSKLKDQLMTVKTNKEYTAMLHEIQTAEGHIRAEEDKVLEVMEQMENMEVELKQAEKELNTRSGELLSIIRVSQSSIPGLQVDLEKLLGQRGLVESTIQTDLLARYRRLADARKGIALAEARDELCTACHVRIRPQVYADLLRTEEIHACDSCSRILFLREVS